MCAGSARGLSQEQASTVWHGVVSRTQSACFPWWRVGTIVMIWPAVSEWASPGGLRVLGGCGKGAMITVAARCAGQVERVPVLFVLAGACVWSGRAGGGGCAD